MTFTATILDTLSNAAALTALTSACTAAGLDAPTAIITPGVMPTALPYLMVEVGDVTTHDRAITWPTRELTVQIAIYGAIGDGTPAAVATAARTLCDVIRAAYISLLDTAGIHAELVSADPVGEPVDNEVGVPTRYIRVELEARCFADLTTP